MAPGPAAVFILSILFIPAALAASQKTLAQTADNHKSKPCNGISVRRTTATATCIKPGSGKSFKDCRTCPEMVIVPAGQFVMGSPAYEPQRINGPEEATVRMTIPEPFAVGRFEVTFDEWDACVRDDKCRIKPSTKWGRSRRPVMRISWFDITKEFLPWLNAKSKLSDTQQYRLLSEAEWEYAARAGTQTPFWWGTFITSDNANYDGEQAYAGGPGNGKYRQRTLPVDRFKPNPWGLYNVHGNVWEWVADCWNTDNTRNPGNGRARTTGECDRRILRGGSWSSYPGGLRSANRYPTLPTFRVNISGFRVARSVR